MLILIGGSLLPSHPRNWGPTTVAIAAQREGAAWRPAKSPWLQPYVNVRNRMQMASQGCRTRAKCSSVFSLSWVHCSGASEARPAVRPVQDALEEGLGAPWRPGWPFLLSSGIPSGS